MDLTNKIQDAFDNIKADARLKESTNNEKIPICGPVNKHQ